jgi:pimeloyl-ACP methyl ester carboxylesterase
LKEIYSRTSAFLLTAPRIAETLDARVVAIDFPGHGQSFHRSPGATYMFTDYILDTGEGLAADTCTLGGILRSNSVQILHAVRVLDALNWKEPVILLGHSMGGGIALMLAAAFPERVRAVISIDSVGVMTKPPKDAVGKTLLVRVLDSA